LLLLALCARYHEKAFYYVAMATLGSLLGCFATDWIGRKSEGKLTKYMPGKRLARLRKLVEKRAGWTLLAASVLPPPFPFTGIVAGAAALQYPRQKLFSVIAVGRFVRFAIEAALAVHYGRWIIRQARSPLLEHIMIALIVISIAGSAYSIYDWLRKGKRQAQHATA
jgi:membrane protein YqaA with SNARE-associated domain